MCAGGTSSSLRPETNRIGAVMDGMRALECQPMRSTKLFMGATHGMTTSTMSGIDVNVFSNMSPLTLAQTSADDTQIALMSGAYRALVFEGAWHILHTSTVTISS